MKKLTCAVICLLMVIGQSCAMQPSAVKAGIKAVTPFLKKGFAGTMTGLHWTIASGIPLTQAAMQTYYYYNQKEIIDSFPNTGKTVTHFIKSRVPTVSIDSIKINPISSSLGGNWGCFNKSIFISPSGYKELKEAIEQEDTEKLIAFQAGLEHEVGHVYHQHTFYNILSYFTAPLISHTIVKKAGGVLLNNKKGLSFSAEQLIKIPSGIGKLGLSMALLMSYSRYQEQQADNAISDNIPLLNGMKKSLEGYEKDMVQKLSQHNISANQMQVIRLTERIFGSHPSTEKRIQKLDQRIALLEKAKKNDSDKS